MDITTTGIIMVKADLIDPMTETITDDTGTGMTVMSAGDTKREVSAGWQDRDAFAGDVLGKLLRQSPGQVWHILDVQLHEQNLKIPVVPCILMLYPCE
jgi:hypothetical protein